MCLFFVTRKNSSSKTAKHFKSEDVHIFKTRKIAMVRLVPTIAIFWSIGWKDWFWSGYCLMKPRPKVRTLEDSFGSLIEYVTYRQEKDEELVKFFVLFSWQALHLCPQMLLSVMSYGARICSPLWVCFANIMIWSPCFIKLCRRHITTWRSQS